jgi:hypothetical protein
MSKAVHANFIQNEFEEVEDVLEVDVNKAYFNICDMMKFALSGCF